MRQIVYEEEMNGLVMDRVIRDYEFNMAEKHIHDNYEIYYLLEGERNYFIEKQTYLVREGSLVFVNRHLIHNTGVSHSSYHDRILIELQAEPFSTFFNCTQEVTLSDFFRSHTGVVELDAARRTYIEALLEGIHQDLKDKDTGYRLSVYSRLSSLLLCAMRCPLKKPTYLHSMNIYKNNKYTKVDEVATYIAANFATVSSLGGLAEHFYISRSYLSRVFKEVTGFTVSEYINTARIRQAQKLLEDSSLNISEISRETGYETVTYFEKIFKKHTGITPLKYRRLHEIHKWPADASRYSVEDKRPDSAPLNSGQKKSDI